LETLELYQKIGQAKAWDHTPEHHRHNKEKAWYDKVKRIAKFYQAEDLIKREWDPKTVDAKGKPVKYLLKHVNDIIRKRLADGSEWLLSTEVCHTRMDIENSL
jgi:hypothetical protein